MPEETQDLPRAVDVIPADMREQVETSSLVDDLSELRVDSDDDDDPVLVRPDGRPVDTWREDYPYDERMARDEYEHDKRLLQIELLKLQNWVKDRGERLVILFEGRDAAGKGGTIKRFMEHLNPRGARVVALEKPSERERTQWYFQRYVAHLPAAGEIVLFDRSWYNRAGRRAGHGLLHPRRVPGVHAPGAGAGADAGALRASTWSSSGSRCPAPSSAPGSSIRQVDPVRQWKLSPMDLASLDKWDDYTEAKEAMFFYTDTADAPWTVVKSNDKKRARLEAMRHVLSVFPYAGRDDEVVGRPDPKLVGRGLNIVEGDERAETLYPML